MVQNGSFATRAICGDETRQLQVSDDGEESSRYSSGGKRPTSMRSRSGVLRFEANLMFVNNCGAHGNITNLKAAKLEFLPPNTTSVLQPMDQGVIKNLKVHYRSRLLNRVLLCVDSGKNYVVDVLSAIGILSAAWKAATVDTMCNCFCHAGFVLDDEDSATGHDSADELPLDTNIIDGLRASGIDIPAVMFEQFNTESAILPCAELDGEEIVRQVLQPPQVDSDSDDDASLCL